MLKQSGITTTNSSSESDPSLSSLSLSVSPSLSSAGGGGGVLVWRKLLTEERLTTPEHGFSTITNGAAAVDPSPRETSTRSPVVGGTTSKSVG
jgi:hypothetical protein